MAFTFKVATPERLSRLGFKGRHAYKDVINALYSVPIESGVEIDIDENTTSEKLLTALRSAIFKANAKSPLGITTMTKGNKILIKRTK